jgi:hypothetical protein
MAAGALALTLLLAGCGPYAREITNTGRGVNGSSVTSTDSVLKQGEKAGESHGGEVKP